MFWFWSMWSKLTGQVKAGRKALSKPLLWACQGNPYMSGPQRIEAAKLYSQAYWEQDMAIRGFDKVMSVEEPGGEHAKSVTTLQKKLFGRLFTSVKTWYAKKGTGNNTGCSNEALLPLLLITEEQLTAAILTWMVSYPHRITEDAPIRSMAMTTQAMSLGRLILDTAAFNTHLKCVETRKNFMRILEQSKRKKTAKWELQKLYREFRNEHQPENIVKVGSIGITLALETFPEYLEQKLVRVSGKTYSVVCKTQAWWDLYSTTAESIALSSPFLLPTILEPKPWSASMSRPGEATDGGYYFLRRPMVRNVGKSVKPLFRLSETTVKALNHAQNTAWALNERVHNTLRKALEEGVLLPGAIPILTEKPTVEEQGAFSEFQRIVGAAEDVMDKERFYFPKSYDWRLRMYDLPNDLKPQGGDLARGLLRFADGQPIGREGRYWLAVHLGNLLGKDKATYDERIQAVEDNSDLIERIASDPLQNREWTEMEDPWQFLAACFEWVEVNSSDKARNHIPVSLDGSCSGMQHFSMLTRDFKGALATNCTSDPNVHDLYSTVAARVRARVEYDAARGEKLALLWWDKISDKATARKVCKRAVMTVPYGVTDRGITKFMITDKHVSSFPKEDRWSAAIYMTTLIRAALDDTMSNARSAQAYINTVAYTLALKGKPLAWRTPAGSIIAQGYKNMVQRRIKTPYGALVLLREDDTATFDHKRAKLATSPNVIHSLDAAHLQLVVSELMTEDITDIFLVHDSFGVHAENVPILRNVLRHNLHAIYKVNQLEEWRRSVEELSGERLPPPPELGDWDIEEVLRAEYLFA